MPRCDLPVLQRVVDEPPELPLRGGLLEDAPPREAQLRVNRDVRPQQADLARKRERLILDVVGADEDLEQLVHAGLAEVGDRVVEEGHGSTG